MHSSLLVYYYYYFIIIIIIILQHPLVFPFLIRNLWPQNCGWFWSETRINGLATGFLLMPDRSLLAQPISTQEAQSRKKTHKPLCTSWISEDVGPWPPCLTIIKSYCFDPYTFSLLVLRFVLCSLDLDAKYHRLQFILITHKSTRSEHLIRWLLLNCCYPIHWMASEAFERHYT